MLFALSKSKDNGGAGDLQGGFIHILLLVFFVMSVTLWGVSEIYFRASEKQQEAKRRGDSDLRLAVEALLSYATTPSPRLDTGGSFLPYNAASESPFRRFVLPCPDLGADGNLDGVADFNCNGADNAYDPLKENSRFGRFPWRDDTSSGIRGAGNRDFRGRYSERIWYVVSGNVVDRSDSPVNPNALLKLTSGWLTLVDEDGDVISDRVAALVIAPGAAIESVESEESLFAGEGAVPYSALSATDVDDFAAAYLDDDVYDSLSVNLRITTKTAVDNDSSADSYAYLTVDELIGIDSFHEENLYSQLENGNGFLGISDLLQAHLNRYGYLPDPAVFGTVSALERERLGIMTSNQKVTIDTSGAVIVSLSVTAVNTVDTGLAARNKAGDVEQWISDYINTGLVLTSYALSGREFEIFPVTSTGSFVSVNRSADAIHSGKVNETAAPFVLVPVSSLPPVYIVSDITLSLDSISQLNAIPPYNVALADLDTGLNIEPLGSVIVNDLISEEHYPDDGLFGVYGASNTLFFVDESGIVPFIDTPGTAPITIQSGVPFTAALSEPAFGYFQGDSLAGIISYFDGNEANISVVPPYGVRVLLPAGTRLTMDTSSIAIHLPSNYRAGGSYDPVSGLWSLEPSNQAVLIDAPDNYIVELPAAIPGDWPIVPGDFGFLPFNKDANTRILTTAISVSLATGSGAVSDLAVDIGLYTENRLTVVPFPPPGRPSPFDFQTSISVSITISTGTPPVTNTISTTITLASIAYPATPLFIGASTEFSLPVGTRISYSKGGVFNLGTDFAFPNGAVAYFPPDAVLQVVLPISAVSPGGRSYENSTIQTLLATLHHGGMLGIGASRAVLEDGFGLGSGQELFDIELRDLAQVLSNDDVILNLPANSILQPYTGRVVDAVGPVDLGDVAILNSPTRIRGRFLTSERNAVYHADGAIDVGNFALSSLSISFPHTVSGTVSTATITTNFDEDTAFWISAGSVLISKSRIVSSGIATGKVPRIVLQLSTGVSDADFRGLSSLVASTDIVADDITLNFYNAFQELLALTLNTITITSQGVPISAKIIDTQVELTNDVPNPGGERLFPRTASEFIGHPALATANLSGPLADEVDNYTFLQTSLSFTTILGGSIHVYDLEVDGDGNYQPYFSTEVMTATSLLHNPLPDFRLNNFALFLDNDIQVVSSDGITAALLAGGVVDVANADYWPPIGIQRLKRVADDLEVVSPGEIRIHLPERTALRTDIDEHIITLIAGVTAIAETAAPDSVVLPYVQYSDLDADNAYVNHLSLTVRGSLSLPANAMIIIPAGQPLEFLSENTGTRDFSSAPDISLYAELVDYAHLPTGAVAVIPPEEEFYYATTVNLETITISHVDASITSSVTVVSVGTVSLTVTNYFPGSVATIFMTATSAVFPESGVITMTGPGYLPLADGIGRAAFINNKAHLPVVPLVFLSEIGRLIHGNVIDNLQDNVLAFVPANSRLDIMGYMETRAEQGVFSDLLPADYEALLRDHPMGYAVAPECRRHAVAAGGKCGDGPGLTFNVPDGEEVILSEEMEAPAGGLLTVTHPGASLIVRHQSFDDYLTGSAITTTATISAALIDHDNGLVSFPSGTGVTANPGDVLRFQLAPHSSASVIRMYFGRLNFGDSVDDVHYADINGEFTVNVGGIVRDMHENAASKITIDSGTTLNLGVGAKIRNAINGEKIFGDGSFVSIVVGGGTVELPLSDYSIIDAREYSAFGTLAMAVAEVDGFGGVYETYQAYDGIDVFGVGPGINISVPPPAPPIEVADDGFIEMSSGYLWQGYIPPGSTLSFTSSDNPINEVLGADVFLRVQPTVRVLNFFGSGLERPEGLDGRSPAPAASIVFNAPGKDVVAGVILSVQSSLDVTLSHPETVYIASTPFGRVGSELHYFYHRTTVSQTIYSNAFVGGSITLTQSAQSITTFIFTTTLTSTLGNVSDITTITLNGINLTGGAPISTTLTLTNEIQTVTLFSDTTLTAVTISASTLTIEGLTLTGKFEFTASIVNYQLSVTVYGRLGNYVPGHPALSDIGFADINYTAIITAATSQSKTLYSRVHDNNGVRTVAAIWNAGGFVWNRYSNPFPAIYSNRFDSGGGIDLWGLPDVDDIDGNSNPSYIDNFMCNGNLATAYFEPPPIQMAASLITPKTAWTLSVSGVNYQGLTIALPITGRGADITVAEQISPDYVPLVTPPGYLTLSTTLPVSVNVSGIVREAVAHSDLVFYMDNAYNQYFGQNTITATLTNYAVIPHTIVVVTHTIAFPSPSGRLPPQTIHFGDDFEIVGPGAIVPPFGGNNMSVVAEVYAARSKLFNDLFGYPKLSPIYDDKTGDCVGINDCAAMFNSSDWIPIVGGAIALDAVKVSVSGPSPQLLMPQPQALVKDKSGNTVTVYAGSILLPREKRIYPATSLKSDYMLFMSGPGEAAIDVSPAIAPRPVRLYRTPLSFGKDFLGNDKIFIRGVSATDFNYAPVATNVGNCIVEPLNFGAVLDAQEDEEIYNYFENNIGANITNDVYNVSLTASYFVNTLVDQAIRYDGSFTRGVLLNDLGASLVVDKNSGRSVYTSAHGFATENMYNAFPRYNNDYQLGNALSYHWVAPGAETFLPMGGQRANVGADYAPSGLIVTNSGQFESLRLVHKIDIPRTAIPVHAFQGEVPYPDRDSNMFKFPSGSEVMVVNADAGSWESIHPYLGIRNKGLRVALMTISVNLGVTTTVNRGNVVVGQYDDAYVRKDISNKRLLHYTRSESLPADPVFSSTPIYSNVWIRLPDGGRLEEVGGSDVIYLPPDSIVNPLMGTYLSGDIFNTTGGATESRIQNSYLSQIVLSGEIKISRSAYLLPKGTKVVVADSGARFTNVKAAVFFSLVPKDGVDCPYGDWKYGEEQADIVQISQTREGISENSYNNAVANGIVNIGHPCAWFDDKENTDGDNVFLYRGRRRSYVSDLSVHETSNDRTYLVGGVLRLN